VILINEFGPKSKTDEFSKRCIFLGGLQKWVVNALFKFPKLPEDVVRIIKITDCIEADRSKRRSSAPFQQSSLNKMHLEANSSRSLVLDHGQRIKVEVASPIRGTTKKKTFQ
jgi:hypothetical protein